MNLGTYREFRIKETDAWKFEVWICGFLSTSNSRPMAVDREFVHIFPGPRGFAEPMGPHGAPWAPHGRPMGPMGRPWGFMDPPGAPHGPQGRKTCTFLKFYNGWSQTH